MLLRILQILGGVALAFVAVVLMRGMEQGSQRAYMRHYASAQPQRSLVVLTPTQYAPVHTMVFSFKNPAGIPMLGIILETKTNAFAFIPLALEELNQLYAVHAFLTNARYARSVPLQHRAFVLGAMRMASELHEAHSLYFNSRATACPIRVTGPRSSTCLPLVPGLGICRVLAQKHKLSLYADEYFFSKQYQNTLSSQQV
jgi:hypothetical protein